MVLKHSGFLCNALGAQVGSRLHLCVPPRSGSGASFAALRGYASSPLSTAFARRALRAMPNHSLKLTPHGLQNWPRSAYAHAASRGQFYKPRGSA